MLADAPPLKDALEAFWRFVNGRLGGSTMNSLTSAHSEGCRQTDLPLTLLMWTRLSWRRICAGVSKFKLDVGGGASGPAAFNHTGLRRRGMVGYMLFRFSGKSRELGIGACRSINGQMLKLRPLATRATAVPSTSSFCQEQLGLNILPASVPFHPAVFPPFPHYPQDPDWRPPGGPYHRLRL